MATFVSNMSNIHDVGLLFADWDLLCVFFCKFYQALSTIQNDNAKRRLKNEAAKKWFNKLAKEFPEFPFVIIKRKQPKQILQIQDYD